MATQVIKTVFQFRRATTAEWLEHKDEVPAAGEPCFDIELNTLKIGNGVDSYEKLDTIGGVKLEMAADGKSIVLEDKLLKLMGFDAAPEGSYPMKNADGTLSWVIPSTEDIETLKEDVANLKTEVSGLKETDGTLLSKIGVLENKMDGTGEGTVDAKIDAKIKAFEEKVVENGTIDTIQELFDYVAEHGAEAKAMPLCPNGTYRSASRGSARWQHYC